MQAIDLYLEESQNEALEFEKNTHQNTIDTEEPVDIEDDENDNIQEEFEPVVLPQDDCHSRTTMFFNKYGENPDIPSIANRLADAIVNFEINNAIKIDDEDDFLIDNEIVTEEQFIYDNTEQAEMPNHKDFLSNMKMSVKGVDKELETF